MTPIGDIARSVLLQSQTKNLRSIIQAKTDELASGLVHDPRAKLKGETGRLHSLQNELQMLDAYRSNIEETRSLFDARQRELERVHTHLSGVVETSLAVHGNANEESIRASAQRAFVDVVASLKSSFAGRPVFPIASASLDTTQLLDQVSQQIAAHPELTPEAAARAEISDVLNSPEGSGMQNVPVSQYRSVSIADTLVTESFNEILTDLALTALGHNSGSSHDVTTRFTRHRDNMVQAQVRAGEQENQIERAQVRNASEKVALQELRNDLLAADPFDAATQLQSATLKLETLFAATARISRLSLTNYL